MLQVFARPRVVGGGNLSYPEPLSRTQLWPSAGRSAAAETEIVFDDNTRSECSLIGCRVADAVRAHELSADAIGLGCGVQLTDHTAVVSDAAHIGHDIIPLYLRFIVRYRGAG
jgi:hypothetical protein